MNKTASIIILYAITILVIGFLLYFIFNRPQKVKVYNKLLPPQNLNTHWWGYGWRPWWRRYGGVPGLGSGKPFPKPLIPKPGRAVIIQNAS